ncbi:MAG TPA: hypothetical protein VGX23_24355 [Actinocrinis sp.]|nr:hypothetical protein [Actinocrinis sp.]
MTGAGPGTLDSAVDFATAGDRCALGAYLARLLHFDKTAAVRFVGVGAVAAAYGGPPFGGVNVLSVRTIALAPGSAPFDTTVSAGQLLDAVSKDSGPFRLPAALLGGPAWAGLLPPRTGWIPIRQVPVNELAAGVAEGNAEFRFRALGHGAAADGSFTALAEDIWSRDVTMGLNYGAGSRGLSLRAAHAAQMLGFLGPEPLVDYTGQARIALNHRWLRLDAPFGTVIERLRFDQD